MKEAVAVGTKRVLVVDDFEEWRRFFSSTVEKDLSLRVISEASDGLRALVDAAQLQPDLVLLDIGLPKLNGIEVARQVAKVSPKSVVLFVSQNSDTDVVQEALTTGARGYVLKADGARDLEHAIGVFLAGGTFVSHSLDRFAET